MPLSFRDFIHLRQQAGLTQDQLAHRLNLPRTAISKIENGSRVLAFEEAVAWADACGAAVLLSDGASQEGTRLLGALSGRRLRVGVRMLALLRYLEEPHLLSLDSLMTGWEKFDSFQASGDRPLQAVVKKM